jgi:amino acid transporter
MTRIFTTLAFINFLALVLTSVVGLPLHFQDPMEPTSSASSLLDLHFYLGLFATLYTLLVHCIIFIYFLATGRFVKEVALAYRLPDDPLPRLTRELKRRTFPPALAAMLLTMAALTAGAGAHFRLPQWPWPLHASLAAASLVVNLWAFWVEYRNVRTNGTAIAEVMGEVDRLRAARGLPPNADALQ